MTNKLLKHRVVAQSLSQEEWDHIIPLRYAAKRYLVVAGYSDFTRQQLVLFREGGACIRIPFDAFKPSGTCSPDFSKLSIIDYGNTVKLGEYEVNTYSIT